MDGLLLRRDAHIGGVLAQRDSVYDDMVVKFLEQLVW